MLKSCEIDFNNPPAKAQEIISAGDVPLGTQGNLCCITGGEGTGKSNYVAALVAGSIRSEDIQIDTLGINVSENTKHKAVLLYDTIVQSMDRYYFQYGGIQLVVIDGIADLVRCANDEAESVAIIDELYRLAGIYKTCIICVLHFVPNGLKLRGHLGSELQRKAAAILSIEKDEDPALSVVKALKVRDGSPLDVPLMLFSWDKAAGMHLYRGEKTREEKEKRKEKELVGVARDVFGRQEHITYIDPSNQSYFMIGII